MNHKSIIGQKFNRLTVLYQIGNKSFVRCECGKEKFTHSCNLKVGAIQSCGCLRREKQREKRSKQVNNLSPSWKGFGEISGKYFNRMKSRAIEERNLDFSISIEYTWNLFLKQNRKCALSGIDLMFNQSIKDTTGTASLDRIEPSQGYIEGNVQWVHKEINEMKWDKTQTDFIDFCRLVANNHPLLV